MRFCSLTSRAFGVVALLGIHAGLLAWGAYIHSPTLNEPGHLVAGISNWQFGRFDVYKVNPPLVRMVAALPVMLSGAKTDWSKFYDGPGARPEFSLGEDFVAANGERSMWLFTLARWACIPFSLLGGYLCYRWAREMYGSRAGFLALALWCFCPNILAHGQLITSDVAATSLGLAACYTFWHWLRRPTWGQTLVSGLTLGAAELAKMTLIVFVPLWFAMWLVYRWPDRRAMAWRTWLREFAMLAARMVLALYVVNFGYGFEGAFTRLGDFKFVSASLGAEGDIDKAPIGGGNCFAGSWLGSLPVPLPKNYVLGIDLQRRDFENYGHPSYLRGEFRERGWWYYYLYALAIKVPLGTWVLVFLAATKRWWSPRTTLFPRPPGEGQGEGPRFRDEFILLCPPIVLLAFVSSQTGFSEHMRYVLPAFPFLFIWIGRIAAPCSPVQGCPQATREDATLKNRSLDPHQQRIRRSIMPALGRCLAAAALAWSIGSSLWIYPHSLSYFNELVGGPGGGPAHLINSNVDWGQDLLLVKRWLDDHPVAQPLNLLYFGYFNPKYAGIVYTVPELHVARGDADPIRTSEISPGWHAVSVNFVRGFPFFVYKPDGTKGFLAQGALSTFQQLEPVAKIGYSIYLYNVPQRD